MSEDNLNTRTNDDNNTKNISKVKNIYQNYDSVLKEAFTLFQNNTLDFLDPAISSSKVSELLNTEDTRIELDKTYSDLLYKLEDGTGLHIEMEIDISKDDFRRFHLYNASIEYKYKMLVKTVILTNINPSNFRYTSLSCDFYPVIINLKERNADEVLEKLKIQIKNGKEINLLELIYLPMYNSKKQKPHQLMSEVIDLTLKLPLEQRLKEKVIALSIVLSNKLISHDELIKLWEEKHMVLEELDIVKIATNELQKQINEINERAQREKEKAQREQERAQREQERAQREQERAQKEKERAQKEKERAQKEKERAQKEKEKAQRAEEERKIARKEQEKAQKAERESKEEKFEMLRRLLLFNFPTEQLVYITGLSAEKIEEIKLTLPTDNEEI